MSYSSNRGRVSQEHELLDQICRNRITHIPMCCWVCAGIDRLCWASDPCTVTCCCDWPRGLLPDTHPGVHYWNSSSHPFSNIASAEITLIIQTPFYWASHLQKQHSWLHLELPLTSQAQHSLTLPQKLFEPTAHIHQEIKIQPSGSS